MVTAVHQFDLMLVITKRITSDDQFFF